MGAPMEQLPQALAVEPKEILEWTQIAYYGAGALVACCIVWLKVRAIRRKKDAESE